VDGQSALDRTAQPLLTTAGIATLLLKYQLSDLNTILEKSTELKWTMTQYNKLFSNDFEKSGTTMQ